MIPKSVIAMEQPEATPLPLLNRRMKMKTREVSSRFMSPMAYSKSVPNSAPTPTHVPDPHPLKYTQKCQNVQERDDSNKIETAQNVESLQNHQQDQEQNITAQSVNKRYQPRVKPPLKENNEGTKTDQEHTTKISQTKNSTFIARSKTPCPRPDTPITDTIVSSRYKVNSHINGKGGTVSDATKLLKETIRAPAPFKSSTAMRKSNDDMEVFLQKKLSRTSRSHDDSSGSCTSIVRTKSSGSCPNSPLMYNNKIEVADVNSTDNMNEIDCSMFRNSPCFRSLDFPMSRNEHVSSSSMFRIRDSKSSAVSASIKPSISLPPHPSLIKLRSDTRKWRKDYEDVHYLKLLYNHYIKWRFANARAEVLMCSQEMETKKQVNSLSIKLTEMYNSVKSKRIELEYLQRYKALATVIKSQMPYLNQWSDLEEDYSNSLSETVNSLHSLSLRIPTSSEVKVDIRDLGEVLNQAIEMMEMVEINTKLFITMAEEKESLVSELAMVVNGERVKILECGDYLFKMQSLSVEECSMRGHVMSFRWGVVDSERQTHAQPLES